MAGAQASSLLGFVRCDELDRSGSSAWLCPPLAGWHTKKHLRGLLDLTGFQT